jgi:ribosomal protein S18 acetylase RimI-like enzyme
MTATDALYAANARRFGPLVYTAEQTAAWEGFAHDAPAFRRYIVEADTWLAADAGGRVLGFCGIVLMGERGDEAEVRSLYVAAEAGRQGLGRRLLHHALARSRAAGARRFHAWATPFGRPLFERAGMPLAGVVQEPFAGVMFERYRMSGDAAV